LFLAKQTQHVSARVLKRSSGFTLLESLLALLLVAVVLPALMGAVRSGVRMASLTEDRTLAMQLAEAKMQELLINESWNSIASTGRFGDEGMRDEEIIIPPVSEQDPRQWRWEIEVASWQDQSASQVTVMVIWDRWGRERLFQLDTVVHNKGGL